MLESWSPGILESWNPDFLAFLSSGIGSITWAFWPAPSPVVATNGTREVAAILFGSIAGSGRPILNSVTVRPIAATREALATRRPPWTDA